MKSFYVIIILLLIGYYQAESATIQVNNQISSYGNTWRYSIESAINIANTGDTILVASSSRDYGDVEVDKPLTIIGKRSLANFTIKSPGVQISGFEGSIDLDAREAPNRTLENIIISDCKISSLGFLGSDSVTPSNIRNTILINNVFNNVDISFASDSSYAYLHLDTLTITNNIFSCSSFQSNNNNIGEISGTETIFIRNNNFFESPEIFRGIWDDLNIENNIFYLANPQTTLSSSYINNLVFGDDTISDTNDIVLDNIIGNPKFTIAPSDCNDEESDYTLEGLSPALGAGSDGTDIGITGGAYPFTAWTLADWPNVELSTNESGILGNDMELTFTPTGAFGYPIDYAEYFVIQNFTYYSGDIAPGSGTPIPIISGDETPQSFTIPATVYDNTEFYHVHVRVRDIAGRYSIAESKRIYIYDASPPVVDTTSSPIVYAEYFIDTDPGVGNGEPITLNDSTDIQSISIPMMNQDTGHYYLYVRVMDELGRYSIAERQQFYIGPPIAVVDTFGVDSLILPYTPGFILDVVANDDNISHVQDSCDTLPFVLSIITQSTQGTSTVVFDLTGNCSKIKYEHGGVAGWDSLQYSICDTLNFCDTTSVFLKIYQPLDALDEPVVLDELIISWEGRTETKIDSIRMILIDSLGGELLESCNCNKLDLWRFRDFNGININEKKQQARESTGLNSTDISFNYIRKIFDPPPEWNMLVKYPEIDEDDEPRDTVPIAVVDSGIDSISLSLFTRYFDGNDTCVDTLVLPEWGYNASYPEESPYDDNGHGTHIAEILQKESNELIKLYFAKVVDSTGVGKMFHTICGIHKAIDEGVKVINLSLGYQGEESQVFREVVDKAEANDVLLVTSAGNDTLDIDIDSLRIRYWPSNFEHDNIISVGAHNPDKEKCPFSNYGVQSVDLFAPGRDILSRKLGSGQISKSGTSQAAAIVSRQVAILRSQFPDSTYVYIKDTLFNYLDTIPQLIPLSVTGGILPLDYDTIILPIELIYFTAFPDNIRGSIGLSWEVTTESTVDKFIVEYSRNAIDFSELAAISLTENKWDYTYAHVDVQPNMQHYYRLKMVEPDGTISYSDIEAASLFRDDYNPVSIHPNPIDEAADLKFEGFAAGNGQLMIYDSYGSSLVQKNISIKEGVNTIRLNVNGLSTGFYTLQLIQGEYQWTGKFIKM